MKNTLWIGSMLSLALLVFTCTTPKPVVQQPEPAFNPAPTGAYLSPEASLKSMRLPRGYHLELVASEPMIKEPVAIAWDGNAKMYVAEMLTYMQDADATGEQLPISRISLLEDTDNDGKMDKSSVFIDKLLLPRMIQCVNHELLVNETNTLAIHSYEDTDGDGKADKKKLVYDNPTYKNTNNMEHQRSGLDWNLDNWMYLTYDPVRFRYTNGTMQVDTLVSGSSGQWGLTHDNYGRLYFSSAGGENPVLGFQINPVYGSLNFDDQFTADFQEVWPIMATPDVQGGYKRLRPNVTLNHFTASTGQSIFRGDNLPADLVGDYLVTEPVARIIRRAKVTNTNGKTTLKNAYQQAEFMASSDMNFRPVNTYTGPDGNLYVVDMHRGIIQQANWTKKGSFLRNRIDSLGLAANTGHGRIYRVVHDGFRRYKKPTMLDDPSDKLLTYLGHPNGWWRDNAQKQLIARGDKSVIPALKQLAVQQREAESDERHLARIHALWTLEGLNALDKEMVGKALHDKHAQVRKTAIWLSEPWLKRNDESMIAQVGTLANDASDDVRVQLLLSLYASKAPGAAPLVNQLVAGNTTNEMMVATKQALDKNEDVRKFGRRLGNLTAADRTLILDGASTFKSLCATCHGPEGKGLTVGGSAMPAPPLVGSKRLQFDNKNMAIRIVLHGLSGPVDGKEYPSVMPSMSENSDEWIASIASYIRYEFGGNSRSSPAVKPEEVRKIRASHTSRTEAWTLAELEAKQKEEVPASAAK
ncbi:DUF7133 domain-containing protein [Spirosoma utsteinense]|uniref:Glucose/arabinose dehydrogenase/mono/diheme cytochrome c family protein n=1 Tax=Spirosoma utsteinense TaxID=2585773 RepID=A0ABR6WCN5_9BACT|nr:c-type cytochrome [Spirosoma utsteinense]MBC3793918.1 glucose/arabinose dehydrogenase/mono/diheme cytochrome c family protein [Spirosoma utsteinense]